MFLLDIHSRRIHSVYIVPLMPYSTSNICVTVKSELLRGSSRSPFDRPYATFYWSAIVNIALSCTIFEIFDVDLEIWVRDHSRSLKLVPFKSLVFYSPSIVTMAVSVTVCKILSVRVV